MENNIELSGKIFSAESGSEASLIIPIGEINIMILSDDNCVGDGDIRRSELVVYTGEKPSTGNLNEKIFGQSFVFADTETLCEAIQYCQRQLMKFRP